MSISFNNYKMIEVKTDNINCEAADSPVCVRSVKVSLLEIVEAKTGPDRNNLQ